jgi:hypothetical protein
MNFLKSCKSDVNEVVFWKNEAKYENVNLSKRKTVCRAEEVSNNLCTEAVQAFVYISRAAGETTDPSDPPHLFVFTRGDDSILAAVI